MMALNDPKLRELRLSIAYGIDEIAKLLAPEYELTLICRNPNNDDATIIVSCDNEWRAIEAAERQLLRDAVTRV
jgi:hypothetical protein